MLTAQQLIIGDTKIASAPDVYQKITKTIADPTKNGEDLAVIINLDAGLATRILSLVNSAFYSFATTITSVSHAISILGTKEINNLVLTTVVIERFSKNPNHFIPMSEFWSLSVKCALFSRALAKQHKKPSKLSALYICGLLHRIGLIIIYSKLPELAQSAILRSKNKGVSEVGAQKEILGFSYADVGGALALQWKLPEVIQVTLQNHLNPELLTSNAVESSIVCLARQLSEIDTSDKAQLAEFKAANKSLWVLAELDATCLEEVLEEVDESYLETYRMIYQG